MHRDRELPSEIEKFEIDRPEVPILDLLCDTKLAGSKNEAKRLVEGGAVKINEVVERDWKKIIKTKKGTIIQVGKRKFLELI